MNRTVVLNGSTLTTEEVTAAARGGARIEIAPASREKAIAVRALVMDMLEDRNLPRIYGFNTGVGMNKDWDISAEGLERFNRCMIYSHSAAVGPEATEEHVRATMIVRLNCLLTQRAGVQPEVMAMYEDFLNHRIHPVIPSRGSIGESDLVNLAHIGLTFMGEGEVDYNGVRMSTAEAMAKAGLKPLRLGAKDGLSIVNSSAFGVGRAALLMEDTRALMDMMDLIYALALEGLGGHVTPLDPAVYVPRPVPGPMGTAARVRKYLEGSFLWEPRTGKSLQDPLCFRSACHINGAVRDAMEYVDSFLSLQMNCSDENPCLIEDERRIISCSNFDPTSLAIGFEMLGQALSHVSKNICYQMIKLGNNYFTELPRFLSPDGTSVMAFTTNQKTYTMLDAENRLLSNPVSVDYISVSGEVEDHATNLPLIV
ncbi:aromatic amino acid lyase, partial [Desulfovibrio sp. OttesenSCG-928-I05]|nr:aromatic amino acid lyase [Desulfovibrio sp. OttesenSCG-928-I05]